MSARNEVDERRPTLDQLAAKVAKAPAIEAPRLVEPQQLVDLAVAVYCEESASQEAQSAALELVLAEFVPRLRRCAADWLAGDATPRGLSVRIGL